MNGSQIPQTRRQEMIQALVEVISREGIEGATTRKIARQADVSLAALHYHFSSKEELITAAFDNLITCLEENPFAVEEGEGLNQAAADIFRQYISWYKEEEGYSITQLEIYFYVHRINPTMADTLYGRAIQVVEDLLKRGARPDDDVTDANCLARCIIAYVDGIVAQSILNKGNYEQISAVIEKTSELLLMGVRQSA